MHMNIKLVNISSRLYLVKKLLLIINYGDNLLNLYLTVFYIFKITKIDALPPMPNSRTSTVSHHMVILAITLSLCYCAEVFSS